MHYTGTYSPEDNKLRLYASARLPEDVYREIHAAGFRWAPKQDLFVAPMWTPQREDVLTALCGEIGDEDTSLVERSEERAGRFADYRAKRTTDAESAHDQVERITSGIPLGQPILVGHHSERHARRDQERIENGMRRALKMWETAAYWRERAAGALRHAKYKELPTVRARRIKVIEADRRKSERQSADAANIIGAWRVLDAPSSKTGEAPTPDVIRKRALFILGRNYGLWHELESGAITVRAAMLQSLKGNARVILINRRWIAHFDLRLEYEKAMLAEQGASDLIAPKPRAKGKTVYPICNYRAPGGITCANPWDRNRPIHYPQVEMTQAEYTRLHDDFKGTRVCERSHRIRTAMMRHNLVCVFLTDSKVHTKPAPVEPPDPPPAPAPRPFAEPREAPPERAHIETLREAVRTGVQVVAAPQLFPTPRDVAQEIADLACIEPGHRVLEPSAGTGMLIGACGGRMFGHNPERGAFVAVEINGALCAQLRRAYPLTRVICGDFLNLDEEIGTFDRILMNPPFEQGSDIKHIERARQLLNPGGVLVAICGGGPRQREKYAECIERELPAGTFAGTGVTALILRIESDVEAFALTAVQA